MDTLSPNKFYDKQYLKRASFKQLFAKLITTLLRKPADAVKRGL